MSGPEQTRHLDDETFCALADGVLEGEERDQALAHLSSCSDCLSQWAGLLRNLEAAGEEQELPEALLEQARRKAPAQEPESRESFWAGLFGVARPWQWGLAWGTATAVLLATLYLSPDAPQPDPRLDIPRLQPARTVAQAPQVDTVPARDEPAPARGPGDSRKPHVASRQKGPTPQASPREGVAGVDKPTPNDRKAAPQPLHEPVELRLAHGLSDESSPRLRTQRIGTLLAATKRHARMMGDQTPPPALSEDLDALSLLLRQAGEEKLSGLAASLSKDLQGGSAAKDVLRARLQVLNQALAEWLAAPQRRSVLSPPKTH